MTDKKLPWGYSNVTIIPEGAARIEIMQEAYHRDPADDNYLALVDPETGEYLLNGNWVVTPFEKLVEYGGSLLAYTGSNHPTERINSTKPLKKKLLVQVRNILCSHYLLKVSFLGVIRRQTASSVRFVFVQQIQS